jgi:3-hydroxyacyl-[acyl-carrier-protein] dehydratase
MSLVIDIEEILKILPHRYPFLLIDKVTDITPGKNIQAIKNVTFNEPYFVGHFPQSPIMPGVLIIEALAQAAAILIAKTSFINDKNVLPYLVGIDQARFRKIVVPGDVLMISADIAQSKAGIWVLQAIAKVEGALVAQAKIMATIKKD